MDGFENTTLPPLQITPYLANIWRRIAGWATFLSILGFIMSALAIICLLVIAYLGIQYYGTMRQMMETYPGRGGINESNPTDEIATYAAIGLVVALAFAGSVIFWIQRPHLLFSLTIGQSLRNSKQADFDRSWRHLRNHFRACGIMLITFIVLALVLLILQDSFIPPSPAYY
jgi:hypothetical protein